jgi:hypothetical protein
VILVKSDVSIGTAVVAACVAATAAVSFPLALEAFSQPASVAVIINANKAVKSFIIIPSDISGFNYIIILDCENLTFIV